MRFFRKVRSKLNKKGESLSEVLVSILVSALGLVILASLIISATNMIQNSRKKMSDYYGANNANIESITEERLTGTVGVYLPLGIGYGLTEGDESLDVTYTKNDISDDVSVIYYRLRGLD